MIYRFADLADQWIHGRLHGRDDFWDWLHKRAHELAYWARPK